MAIPFYEPRQQHTATECDQVDGHYPPTPPSSQSMSVPTANLHIPVVTNQMPASTSTFSPTATSSASTIDVNFSAAAATSSTSTATITDTVGTSSTVATSVPLGGIPTAATATFSISSTSTSLPNTFSASTTAETSSSASSSTQPPSMEPLPWKLLAVAMCKALKQYYQQTGSRDVFIEIMPSGVGGGAQEQSPAAGQ